MHRFILDLKKEDPDVDHKDGNGLNNQRSNLRTATRAQNARNRRIRTDNTSGFKGVTWRKDLGKWNAFIEIKTKRIHLGYFTDPMEAACAYDMAAVKYFGEFAHCNFAMPN